MWENDNPMGSTRRKLAIGGVPGNIRDLSGSRMGKIQIWPNQSIVGAIQQLGDAWRVDGNVQILLNALDGRNRRLTALARQRNGEMHRFGDANDRGRWQKQRYEFCKKVWEWSRNQMDAQIQLLGPNVHQDVLIWMNNGRGSFRGELETQLRRVRNVQGRLFQGAQQFSHAVDNKLVQNDQRNDTQGGTIKELFTEMQNLGGRGWANREESARKHSYASKSHNGRTRTGRYW